jgi:hypothetical protein
VGALLAIAASAEPSPSVEVRSFTGSGSPGTDSPIEVYLLEANYHHRLIGSADCYTTASLFPSRDPHGVLLGDVLQADLSAGRSATAVIDPAGTVIISQPGWARLQVGTGRDCAWKYSITGPFVPEGDEPNESGERNMMWWQIAGIAVVVSLTVLALRKRSPKSGEGEEAPIRLIDPANDE